MLVLIDLDLELLRRLGKAHNAAAFSEVRYGVELKHLKINMGVLNVQR